jgi:FKBP-type peptidyl-prolyl cis-trans isomerase SlyD
MKIAEQAWVTIGYKLTLDSGELVDESEPGKPLGFVHGCGQIIPGLESQMTGMDVGDSATLTVEAIDGYGPHRAELVRELPRENFPEDMDIQAGMVFQGHGPHGPVTIRVLGVGPEQIQADFNHPLAGERLHFEVTVAGVRPASEEELAQAQSEPEHECEHGECQGCGQH